MILIGKIIEDSGCVSKTALRRHLGFQSEKLNDPDQNKAGFIYRLSQKQEKELIEWLDWRDMNQMPVDERVLRSEAKKFVNDPRFKASRSWAYTFLRKWNIDKSTPEVINSYSLSLNDL